MDKNLLLAIYVNFNNSFGSVISFLSNYCDFSLKYYLYSGRNHLTVLDWLYSQLIPLIYFVSREYDKAICKYVFPFFSENSGPVAHVNL